MLPGHNREVSAAYAGESDLDQDAVACGLGDRFIDYIN
jgi:hypothetical protein